MQIDRAKVRAVLLERDNTCPKCGTREDEWGSIDGHGVLHMFRRRPYRVARLECPGCAMIDETMNTDADKKRKLFGVRYALKRRCRGGG